VIVVLALVLAVSTAAPSWTETEYEPISADAFVDDLTEAGFENGAMPAHRLIEVEDCLLERDAGYAYALMAEAARADGVELGTEDCYRTYDQQEAAYEARCVVEVRERTVTDMVTGQRTVVASERVTVCSGPPTARPGTSNHGWGRAIDFTSGRTTLDCRDGAFVWLEQNAAGFGWVHPEWAECGQPTAEPWHWEWGGVAQVPPAPPLPPSWSHSVR
jgi:D-alanyl-D-alanine dipeptidase